MSRSVRAERLLPRPRPRLLAQPLAAAALALSFAVAGPAGPASAASAAACASAPSHGNCDGALPGAGCTSGSHYVVDSSPLIDQSGQASWNYGYVQLWWSDVCQTNWSRIVINPGGPWHVAAVVFRESGSPPEEYTDYDNRGPGAYVSAMVYAPDTLACGEGSVVANGAEFASYYAVASQYPCAG